MLKLTALLFNTFALLIYQLFFADTVTITQNIPATAKAGSEFVVELTVNKGSNSGFAKLEINLPEGFTATAENPNGASFAFNKQAAKFIWMSLPAEPQFKVSYKITVPEGVSGNQSITGVFSFIADNVKQKVDIDPTTINITSDGATPAIVKQDEPQKQTPVAATTTATPINTSTTDNTTSKPAPINVAQTGTSDELSIDCFREIIGNTTSPGEFTVEVTIKKGNLGGFAKFIEQIPNGFSVTVINSKEAAFTFSEQKAKFVWGTLPKEEEFKISYKVKVDANKSGEETFEGVFAFIESDKTKKFVLPATTFNLTSSADAQPIAAVTDSPTKTTTPTVTNTPTTTNNTTPTTQVATPTPTTEVNVPNGLAGNNIKNAQTSVNYKVQILALIKPINKAKDINTIATILNVNANDIQTELESGYKKYVVGSHNQYQLARNAREQLPSQVAAPFVVAYNNGNRISVQEALMITSQKWYK